jgi:ribose transport system substrate-binding protein
MLTRRSLMAGSAAAAAGLLWACGRSTRKLIGVVPKATSHLFFVSVHAGVDQAARDFPVDVLWNGPNDETDHARQIQIVDAMVARHVDALAISATDERALVAPLERAIAAGIPVTVFDSAVNLENYVTFVATDNYNAGCDAARRLAALIGGGGQVGMVMQKPGGTSTGLREEGFARTVEKELPRVNIVARQYGMADRARSRAAAENILTAHPDLAGIFASSEAASIGSIQAIRSRGLAGKVKLITFDSSDIHIEALNDGIIDVMLLQDPFRIGYEAVKSLAQKLSGTTPVHRMDLPARAVTKADLSKPEVKALLFPEWLNRK